MKHSDPEFARLAERGTVLRCQVGSGVHGIAVSGQDDRDEMGICVEPPEYVVGLRAFEQYVFRTQPEGVRSGPGDLDLTVYSLRKWTRLALAGNPTVLIPLFVPDSEIVHVDDLGRDLRANAERFVSRSAGHRFLGYLRAQRDRMLGRRGGRTNRPELVDRYGFDVKFAAHMIRLGLQGVELLETGRITLPMPEPWRAGLG
ncbi:nucleotidyltransferase domain-containing protein, partial [Thermobifida halotolerans]|uniref:nucleotidyltransferase domain-containing protein n=1 Tax=Thermobifida halotolerans TaxID=483545 RepID=UPI001F349A16